MGNSKRDQSHNDWDVIVIGSGMGGMAAAAALSRTGHKVLLLEQFHTLGGLTHSFSHDGFTWDVGIHYLGGLAPGDPEKDLLDWLCATPIKFASMGAVYDTLHVGDAEPLRLSRPFEAHELDFKARFPADADAIENWTDAMRKGREALTNSLKTFFPSLPISLSIANSQPRFLPLALLATIKARFTVLMFRLVAYSLKHYA